MKDTQRCPKCLSHRLWRLDQRSLAAHGDAASTSPAPTSLDAYVCALCGYTELYVRAPEELSHDPSNGVHQLDSTFYGGV